MEPPLPPQSATVPADDDLPPLLLLVDDDALARLALEAMLAGDGYRLETAADGSEALVLAARLLPDLILLDVLMPGMDGYEVCRRLRADPALAEVPVLMLTALDDAASRLLGLDAGADDFIAKPADRAELRARVRSITRLNRYRRARERERRLAESQRQQLHSLALLQCVIDNSPDAFLALDENGGIVEWSAQAETMFGWSRAEVLGLDLNDLIVPSHLRVQQRRLHEAVRQTGRFDGFGRVEERVSVRRDGSEFPCEVLLTALPTDRGWRLAGFVRDIGERRDAEIRLRQAEKLEAIGLLTGGLAHDFNNLLNMILGGLELLAPRLPAGDARALRHHDLALRAARRAAEVTRTLLQVARRQPLDAREVDVAAHCIELLPLIRQSAGSGVRIVLHGFEPAPQPPLRACVDAGGLGNALLNLVINARDAMPGGGTLTLEVQLQTLPAGAVPELAAGTWIVIAVTDTGCGMSPAVRARAFDPFFTTKHRGQGTGLGLAMVLGYARQSGGNVTLAGAAGGGTTVRLYLPAVAPMIPRPEAPLPAPGSAAPAGQGERVLLVDDESGLLELGREWLEADGYRVDACSDPRQALAQLQAGGHALLVTDVTMPGPLDGCALAAHACRQQPGLRVLLISGYADDDALAELSRWPLLLKPFTAVELLQAVRRRLDQPGGG